MAFMGMFIIFLVIAFIVIIVAVIIPMLLSLVLFLTSFFMKKDYKKKLSEDPSSAQEKTKKNYLIPRIIGCVLMIPFILLVSLLTYSHISSSISKKNSLGYNVMQGNYSQAEKILIKGVHPDCTLESNEPAKPGEQTLLSLLCEKGFTDIYGNSIDEEETDEELKMIQLLIDYGANMESRTYLHDKDDSTHMYKGESDYYKSSDMCGYTPLLYAVYMGNKNTVKLLIENGADINAEDYCGYNAVSTIADNFSDKKGYALLSYLLDKGCDKNHPTRYCQTADFLAMRNQDTDEEYTNKKIIILLSTP